MSTPTKRWALLAILVVAAVAVVIRWFRFDLISLSAMRGSDVATTVSTGRRGGCDPYAVSLGSPMVFVTNYEAAGGCPSELAVFAKANAMRLQDTTAVWTNSYFDIASVAMQDPYAVPLNVFVMSGDALNHDVAVRMARAKDDLAAASQLWDGNQCGVTYTTTYLGDATRGKFTPDLLMASCTENVARFKAVDDQTAVKGINVFYVDGPSDVQGQTCLDGSSAVILITLWSGNETLAHELGHALSLQHTNWTSSQPWLNGMPQDDLMNSPSTYPAELTIGQCFRANVNDVSRLNTLPVRTEATRSCPDSTTGDTCPALATHR